ncbi:hypothetical protein D3C85_1620930 [compost metagenome]
MRPHNPEIPRVGVVAHAFQVCFNEFFAILRNDRQRQQGSQRELFVFVKQKLGRTGALTQGEALQRQGFIIGDPQGVANLDHGGQPFA